jgi:hypothetical protein
VIFVPGPEGLLIIDFLSLDGTAVPCLAPFKARAARDEKTTVSVMPSRTVAMVSWVV